MMDIYLDNNMINQISSFLVLLVFILIFVKLL